MLLSCWALKGGVGTTVVTAALGLTLNRAGHDVLLVDLAGAGTRTAGFAIAAVVARPIGGMLSDRIGPPRIVAVSLIGAAVLAWAMESS